MGGQLLQFEMTLLASIVWECDFRTRFGDPCALRDAALPSDAPTATKF